MVILLNLLNSLDWLAYHLTDFWYLL